MTLPPPGVGTYCPPILWDQPPHLGLMPPCSSITLEASTVFTPSAYGVDSHCEAAKPSSNANLIYASTQTDLKIS